MKNIRKVIYALIVLNLVVDAAFLVLAPDQVAVHFGASGEADRIGSKYEHLWFPALALAFGLGLPFIAKRSDAHDGDKLLKADVVLLALMAVFSLFVFADGLSSSGSPFAALDLNVGRGAALVAGIAIVICGNIMPKTDRNQAFGLRTPWSQSTAHELGHARHGGHPLGGSRREHRRLVRVLPKALRLRRVTLFNRLRAVLPDVRLLPCHQENHRDHEGAPRQVGAGERGA